MPQTATAVSASKRVAVTESNLRKAASRLLGTKLVSPEIAFIQRALGATATQEAIDAKVVAVRAMPWTKVFQLD